jgi:hypothetical protein
VHVLCVCSWIDTCWSGLLHTNSSSGSSSSTNSDHIAVQLPLLEAVLELSTVWIQQLPAVCALRVHTWLSTALTWLPRCTAQASRSCAKAALVLIRQCLEQVRGSHVDLYIPCALCYAVEFLSIYQSSYNDVHIHSAVFSLFNSRHVTFVAIHKYSMAFYIVVHKQASDANFAQAVTAAVAEPLQHINDSMYASLLNTNSSSSSSSNSISCIGVWLLVVVMWALRGGLSSIMLDECVTTAKALYDRFGTAQTGWYVRVMISIQYASTYCKQFV